MILDGTGLALPVPWAAWRAPPLPAALNTIAAHGPRKCGVRVAISNIPFCQKSGFLDSEKLCGFASLREKTLIREIRVIRGLIPPVIF